MLYCISDASCPMEYISCGNLVNEDGFVHPKRNIDSFVLIVVKEGTLHIAQGRCQYDICENEFVILFPHTLHYGYKPCCGLLSYYWVHFYVRDIHYKIYSKKILLRNNNIFNESADISTPPSQNHFLLPEHGNLSVEKRSHLLFVQLLDFAKRENYKATWRCHYALSLLLLEVADESFQLEHFMDSSIPIQVLDVMEWIRTHYDKPLTVAAIARHFNYHPTYLTYIFKKHTGYPILTFLNNLRITVAKNLLTSRSLSVDQVADMCGFTNGKYFMKLFKRYEGITPTQYRKAFHRRKVNIT